MTDTPAAGQTWQNLTLWPHRTIVLTSTGTPWSRYTENGSSGQIRTRDLTRYWDLKRSGTV
ncbi:hypothetical protein ACFVQ9_35555 [Streptomyces goshikiensis]|uniref:hypothetical protein n=1 Tax=Streptomyces goshikiensis TaxID=1942 RepID=UPI00369ED97F